MYTYGQLIKFRDGRRKNDQMTAFVAKLTDNDVADLAAFYAAQKPMRRTANLDPQKVEDGQKMTVSYQCASCHRADLGGHDEAARLAGQDLTYLRKAIRGFNEKSASDLHGNTTTAAVPLSDDAVEALAHFLASLGGT